MADFKPVTYISVLREFGERDHLDDVRNGGEQGTCLGDVASPSIVIVLNEDDAAVLKPTHGVGMKLLGASAVAGGRQA